MTVPVGTKKRFGPYHKEAKDGRREIYVTRTKTAHGWTTQSTDKARADYEDAHHTKLSKNTDVDHKDNNKGHGALSNLQAMSHSDNVAKENKHRAGK